MLINVCSLVKRPAFHDHSQQGAGKVSVLAHALWKWKQKQKDFLFSPGPVTTGLWWHVGPQSSALWGRSWFPMNFWQFSSVSFVSNSSSYLLNAGTFQNFICCHFFFALGHFFHLQNSLTPLSGSPASHPLPWVSCWTLDLNIQQTTENLYLDVLEETWIQRSQTWLIIFSNLLCLLPFMSQW